MSRHHWKCVIGPGNSIKHESWTLNFSNRLMDSVFRAQQKKPAASVKIAEQISEEQNNVFIDKVSQIVCNTTNIVTYLIYDASYKRVHLKLQ